MFNRGDLGNCILKYKILFNTERDKNWCEKKKGNKECCLKMYCVILPFKCYTGKSLREVACPLNF